MELGWVVKFRILMHYINALGLGLPINSNNFPCRCIFNRIIKDKNPPFLFGLPFLGGCIITIFSFCWLFSSYRLKINKKYWPLKKFWCGCEKMNRITIKQGGLPGTKVKGLFLFWCLNKGVRSHVDGFWTEFLQSVYTGNLWGEGWINRLKDWV